MNDNGCGHTPGGTYVYRWEEKTQQDLLEIIAEGRRRVRVKVRRVGATVNKEGALKSRISKYKYKGYTGTLYLAKTRNMKKAENRLLEYCMECHLNIQKRSNAQPKPGYVYIIKGPPVRRRSI